MIETPTNNEANADQAPDDGSLSFVAFHEVGHVIMTLLNKDSVQKASIIRNHSSAGRVSYHQDMRQPLTPNEVKPRFEEEEEECIDKAEYEIKVLIGGCVAVQLLQYVYASSSEIPVRARPDEFEPDRFELHRFQPDWLDGGGSDREKAYEYLAAVGRTGAEADERIQELWVEVVLTLINNWIALVALSSELFKRKEMSGPEIIRYVNEHRVPFFRTKINWLEDGISVDKEYFVPQDWR